ncbi:MAG: DNA alkylation repair protein [Candidatus Cloacimonetes bacterium HGW-Cloacimonetes-1]|jgi:3-methyladenine DNA glycosylase AlkD|nr:MAG: DNA alkylation repair protein [Candidatus Cloacimonetes bacterium HGW-Cloacimonetes-1]
MTTLDAIKAALAEQANPRSASSKQQFFKAFPGGYGGEDTFLSISVPDQRKISRSFYATADLNDLAALLCTRIHEYRLTALMTLVLKYQKTKLLSEKALYAEFYLQYLDHVDNWDLVDSSAHLILGDYLLDRDPRKLYQLAASPNMWHQRIAMVATYAFIRKGRFELTFELALLLMKHPHDLIHKAVGWMLREAGNRDFEAEHRFVDQYCLQMPRTMLRYAIEKFPEELRLNILRRK